MKQNLTTLFLNYLKKGGVVKALPGTKIKKPDTMKDIDYYSNSPSKNPYAGLLFGNVSFIKGQPVTIDNMLGTVLNDGTFIRGYVSPEVLITVPRRPDWYFSPDMKKRYKAYLEMKDNQYEKTWDYRLSDEGSLNIKDALHGRIPYYIDPIISFKSPEYYKDFKEYLGADDWLHQVDEDRLYHGPLF